MASLSTLMQMRFRVVLLAGARNGCSAGSLFAIDPKSHNALVDTTVDSCTTAAPRRFVITVRELIVDLSS